MNQSELKPGMLVEAIMQKIHDEPDLYMIISNDQNEKTVSIVSPTGLVITYPVISALFLFLKYDAIS